MRVLPLALLSLVLGHTAPLSAQLPVEGDGDPRALLERDWGPLPVPPWAHYEAACSNRTRFAVFSLGVQTPQDAFLALPARIDSLEERARAERYPRQGELLNEAQSLTALLLGGGSEEALAVLTRTFEFLKSRGMIQWYGGPGYYYMMFDSRSERVHRIGYSLNADVSGGAGHGRCPDVPIGPAITFGRR